MATVDQLLAEARRHLAEAPFRPPLREAHLLLGHALGWSEARLRARGERAVPPEAEGHFRALLERRLTGEPVAYLVGEKEFYGRPFRVDRRVLVPRPETEHLVEAVLDAVRRGRLPRAPRLLDLGTGSGCIAVTLALELPRARVVATDVSPAALAVAAANARRLGARVPLVAADLARAFSPRVFAGRAFDAVVSNPPYVGRGEAAGLSPEVVDHEPHTALFADREGEGILSRLLDLGSKLHPGSLMMLEIGHRQLPLVEERLAGLPWNLLEARRDYAGIPRTVVLRRD